MAAGGIIKTTGKTTSGGGQGDTWLPAVSTILEEEIGDGGGGQGDTWLPAVNPILEEEIGDGGKGELLHSCRSTAAAPLLQTDGGVFIPVDRRRWHWRHLAPRCRHDP